MNLVDMETRRQKSSDLHTCSWDMGDADLCAGRGSMPISPEFRLGANCSQSHNGAPPGSYAGNNELLGVVAVWQ